MICEKCREEGKESRIYEGMATTTCMAIQPGWYDEEGDYHPPVNPNRTTQQFHCSNGHTFSKVTP